MKDKTDIFQVIPLHSEQIIAIQACWAGEANNGQQRMALEAIIDDGFHVIQRRII